MLKKHLTVVSFCCSKLQSGVGKLARNKIANNNERTSRGRPKATKLLKIQLIARKQSQPKKCKQAINK